MCQKLVKIGVKTAHFGLISAPKGSNLNMDYQFFEPLKMGPISRETTPKALKMYFFDGGESADRPTQKMKWSSVQRDNLVGYENGQNLMVQINA